MINIGFVCHPGRIEAQSCLLAASIDLHLSNSTRMFAAVAADPGGVARPAARTMRFLERLGVEMRTITNPISLKYPIGNKLACMKLLEGRNQPALFLDTDMLVLDSFLSVFSKSFEFMAKPADLSTSGLTDEEWVQLLTHQGVNAPIARFMTTHDMKAGFPYFNAGFIGLAAGLKISECWTNHAIRLARQKGEFEYNLDQIALTVAVYDQTLDIRPVSEYLNFPAHLRDLPDHEPVRIAHYHHPARIAGNIRARKNISKLLRRYPALKEILQDDAEWQWTAALQPARRQSSTISRTRRSSPNFIITGIPRSGTSLFSAALETLPDTIVVNEPAEIFKSLERPGGYGLSIYYQDLRASILAGKKIENKIDDSGKLIEDTASSDVRRSIKYTPGCADFPLATKNTLAYLARLEQISESMPGSPIFCCIRNPISTIASWIRSFKHLREATPGHASIGTVTDPFLPESERDLLRQIEIQSESGIKRALWWNFLARRILRNLDRLVLVRYEDYVSDPETHLHRAALEIGLKKSGLRSLTGSKTRKLDAVIRSDELSLSEIQSVQGICGSLAARFGYEL